GADSIASDDQLKCRPKMPAHQRRTLPTSWPASRRFSFQQIFLHTVRQRRALDPGQGGVFVYIQPAARDAFHVAQTLLLVIYFGCPRGRHLRKRVPHLTYISADRGIARVASG